MSQKQSQKRNRSQKQAKPKSQKPPALEEVAPEMTPELMMELMQMPVEEIKKKLADKRALLETMNANMAVKMKHLTKLAELKAQVEVEMTVSQRYHGKQKKLVNEGTEKFKEAQALYNELVDDFARNQTLVTTKRNEYQKSARKFVERSKLMEVEQEDWNKALAEQQTESEKADQRIKEFEQLLADKRARNAQKRIELQEKQKVLFELKVQNAGVDVNALTFRLEKAKLSIQTKSQHNQALREKLKAEKTAQGELAMNKIIAEAALEEAEQENAQKTANLEELESKLNEQHRVLKNNVTSKMKERIERIQQGNQNLAVRVQDKAAEIAANQTTLVKEKAQLQSFCKEVQKAEQKQAQKLEENMELAKAIGDAPQLIIDRKQEIGELKEKLEVIKQETRAVCKETKETAHKYSKKFKKEQRRQAFLGVLDESLSAATSSEVEPFDLNISSSMASDIVVNLPKVDLNETNDACAQLEQMKRH